MSVTLRNRHLERLRNEEFDIVVIGAGINGAASAAALAAAGARVAIFDKGDFGSNTSSNSSNFIWGGIKYLETHSYGLVNKLCQSRNRLNQAYPAEIRETRFLATLRRGFRFPGWAMYLGALLYWAIGRFAFRRPEYLLRGEAGLRASVIDTAEARSAVEYSDCYIMDSDTRFVFGFVTKVLKQGGVAVNYVESTGAHRDDNGWTIAARDVTSGCSFEISAKVLVNACGPEANAHNALSGQTTVCKHAYSKGVHLVVRRLTEDHRILVFFASDGRMFFIAPMGSRSCIGTTDTRIDTPYGEVTNEDRRFILANANDMLSLKEPLTSADIISERCGVRPLAVEGDDSAADWLQMSRKHVIEVNTDERYASIFGGKLTDCLNVGEDIVDTVRDLGLDGLRLQGKWYGEPDNDMLDEFMRYAEESDLDSRTDPRAHEPLSQRLWRRYGQYTMQIVRAIEEDPNDARVLFPGSDYTAAEFAFALENEMITRVSDLLRRRSDIAMVVPAREIDESLELKRIRDQLGAYTEYDMKSEYTRGRQ